MVKVELLYVSADQKFFHQRLELKLGACVMDAIRESKLWETHPETKTLALGIYSKPVRLDTLLRTGDRIEVYRPLLSDPKDKRRQRKLK